MLTYKGQNSCLVRKMGVSALRCGAGRRRWGGLPPAGRRAKTAGRRGAAWHGGPEPPPAGLGAKSWHAGMVYAHTDWQTSIQADSMATALTEEEDTHGRGAHH